MKIHFICTGNTYRSRLAQTYLNSKKIKNLEVYSSGIEADDALSGPITWWAARLIFNNGLVKYMSYSWQKTNKELLNEADMTIFMEQLHYDFCKKNLGFNDSEYDIWDIVDLDPLKRYDDDSKIESSEIAYKKIKSKVDKLVDKIDA